MCDPILSRCDMLAGISPSAHAIKVLSAWLAQALHTLKGHAVFILSIFWKNSFNTIVLVSQEVQIFECIYNIFTENINIYLYIGLQYIYRNQIDKQGKKIMQITN